MSEFIPVSEPNISQEELEYVTDAVKSTWISSKGKYVDLFEESFAKYIDVKNAISVSNGTVALHLALLALEIGSGDEVIVPNLTYIATANAVTYTGAVPVFANSKIDTWNVDPESIERMINDKTKAIICVHLYGNPCDLREIKAIADKHNLYLIEDAAEAIGTEYDNRKVGSFGKISTFSFYGNKTITTGEGGMVVTDDDDLAEKVRMLKDQGMSKEKRYWFDGIGYNYRMTNIQAAIGYAQMKKINKFVAKKVENANLYNKYLHGLSCIQTPKSTLNSLNTYWMYSIILNGFDDLKRDKFIRDLKEKGIETRPFFYLMTDMPPYYNYVKDEINYDEMSKLSVSAINLPSSTLLTNDQIKYVCDIIKETLR